MKDQGTELGHLLKTLIDPPLKKEAVNTSWKHSLLLSVGSSLFTHTVQSYASEVAL